jgi:hypothetical protein
MTNFNKLVRWDADFYKSLSDDDCIVCLTEKQVYVLGQMIEQINWFRTRWTGDISGLDFDAISGELSYRLGERMTCEQVTNINTIVSNLQQAILLLQSLTSQIFNEVDGGDDLYIWNPSESVVTDSNSHQQLSDYGVTAETCDDEGKDAIYGAVSALVRFINQVNIDLLERVNQAGNLPDQLSRLISGIPGLGVLPIDEVFSWGQFIATELEDEYNATVDEPLLQTVICDLFCIAVANNCHLDFNDVYNYFSGKVEPTFGLTVTTLLDLINFGITGSFSGDQYFYYLCYFQIVVVGLGQAFFGINSMQDYAYQTRAGLNSPDHDWSIFCLDCPPLYRLWTWDFANGMENWVFETGILDCAVGVPVGTYDGEKLVGTHCGDQRDISVKRPFNPTWRILAVKMYTERENGVGNGTDDYCIFKMRPTAGTDTGGTNLISGGFRPNGVDDRCNTNIVSPFYWTGGNEIVMRAGVTYDDSPVSAIYISKVEILYAVEYAELGSVITEDGTLCS